MINGVIGNNNESSTQSCGRSCGDDGRGVFDFAIGDLAFENSPTMVSAYKAMSGKAISSEREEFNTQLAHLRIVLEHTIGILKGRFFFLKSIPMKITNNPKSLTAILRYIDCAIILHNLLISNSSEVPDRRLVLLLPLPQNVK